MIGLGPVPEEPSDAKPPLPLKNAVRVVRKYLPSDYRFHPSVKSAVRRLLDFAQAEERVHVRCLRRVRSLRMDVQIAREHAEPDFTVLGTDKYTEALRVLDELERELLAIDAALDCH